MIASGINDIINVDKDLNHITNGDYDKVGTEDALRDLFVQSGGIVGEALGNKKLGEDIGRVWYNGMDLVLTLHSLDKTIDAFGKNTVPTDHTLKQEVNGLLKSDVSTLFNTDVGVLARNYPGIKNLAINAFGAIDIADKANSVIATGEKSIKVFLPDYESQTSTLSSVFDTFGNIKKGGTNIVKITKFIFG